MSLTTYKKKRKFDDTPEPEDVSSGASEFRYVVQEHHASRLHFDFRLELGGVLKSWAVPKGVPEKAGVKRLAVEVEDHPVDYIDFKGTIPKGNYGAGEVYIFDSGHFTPINEKEETLTEKQALAQLKKGELKVLLDGKLKGSYVLVHMKKDEKNWLLIKHKTSTSKKPGVAKAATPKKKAVAGKSLRGKKNTKISGYIKPMLASPTAKAFDDKDWIYEIKWDGYRAIAEIGKVNKLYSRNGISFEERFPVIFEGLNEIKHDCIIDGEIVWLNEDGTSDFNQIQYFDESKKGELVFQVFDLLELDGQDTKGLTLLQRKELLKSLLGKNKLIRYNDHIVEKGIAFFEESKKMNLEGIIAKNATDTYHTAVRSKSWLKIKNHNSDEAFIVGFTKPKGGRKAFGSLILANKIKGVWKFAGHVGTGFSDKTLKELGELMEPLIQDTPVVKGKIPVNDTPTWIKPVLIAEVKFTEVTKEGSFRHPSFMRLRNDKMEVMPAKKITSKKKASPSKDDKSKSAYTNLDKIFWPKLKLTKGDLINYYEQVSEYIIPHLKDRPLSLKRNPNGILDKGFYHKDAGEHAPDFVKVFPYENEEKVIDYIICNNEKTLLYLANLGCIEMNPWNNRYNKTDKPDWIGFDIDPGDHNTFGQVITIALSIKDVLDSIGLKTYCKTSGASGLHIYLPVHAAYDYDIVRMFSQLVMERVEAMHPKIATTIRSIKSRGKRIYLDFLQNRRGQTLASAYSVRPVEAATVSTPLEWDEVNKKLKPGLFTMKNMPARLKEVGDLFLPVLKEKNNLKKALGELEKLNEDEQ